VLAAYKDLPRPGRNCSTSINQGKYRITYEQIVEQSSLRMTTTLLLTSGDHARLEATS